MLIKIPISKRITETFVVTDDSGHCLEFSKVISLYYSKEHTIIRHDIAPRFVR